VKKLKGRSARKLQEEFKELSKQYWGKHFWAIGYGVWSTRNVSEEPFLVDLGLDFGLFLFLCLRERHLENE